MKDDRNDETCRPGFNVTGSVGASLPSANGARRWRFLTVTARFAMRDHLAVTELADRHRAEIDAPRHRSATREWR